MLPALPPFPGRDASPSFWLTGGKLVKSEISKSWWGIPIIIETRQAGCERWSITKPFRRRASP